MAATPLGGVAGDFVMQPAARQGGVGEAGGARPVPDAFSLLIKPAGPDCQARCRYCFYTRAGAQFPGGPHRMTDSVLRALTEKMLALGLPVSSFCWQGGEPTLMGLDFFRRAVGYQKQFGSGGRSVSNALQTNGLALDESWCAFLSQYRFLVGLSLDGPAAVHEANRGEGTHERVLRAARMMRERGVEFNILCCVSRENENRGAEVYGWLREQGFSFLQFIPVIEAEQDGSVTPWSVTREGYGRFLSEVFDAWLREGGPGRVYVRTFESLLGHIVGAFQGDCSLGTHCSHYVVIEHNGDVYPCDFFVRPDLRLGNIETDELADLARSPVRRRFAREKRRYGEACRRCRYLAWCHGGCLKDRERWTGGLRGETYLCPSYRLFYGHAGRWFERAAASWREQNGRRG